MDLPLNCLIFTTVIILGLFLNTPLILIVSILLYIFTASIGRRRGKKRSKPNSLYNSFYATTLVVTSGTNPSNLVGLKLARSALKIKKLYTKGLSRYS